MNCSWKLEYTLKPFVSSQQRAEGERKAIAKRIVGHVQGKEAICRPATEVWFTSKSAAKQASNISHI